MVVAHALLLLLQDVSPPPATTADIIVTGERRAQSKQHTAASVIVYDRESIERLAAADRLDTLVALTPNVQIGSGGEAPTVRGQDSTGVIRDLPAFLGGTKPRLTLQVDGRPADYFEFIFGLNSLWDVAKVEIFRSPQTVTQGRNAIAGAIFVTTRDPTSATELDARAIASDSHRRQLSLSASSAIAAGVSARLSIDWGRDRPSSRLADLQVGAQPNIDKHELVRLKLRADPLAALILRSTLTHSHSQAPQLVGIRAPFKVRRDPLSTYGVFGTWLDAMTLQADWAVARDLDSSTTVTATHAKFERFAPPGLGQAQVGKRTVTFEQLLRWRAVQSLAGSLGFHFLDEHTHQRIDITQLKGIGTFDDHQSSFGLFGEVDWSVTPKLEASLAARWQKDDQDRTGAIRGSGPAASLDYIGRFGSFLPKATVTWTPVEDLTLGAIVQKASNPGGSTLLLTGVVDRFEAEHLWDAELFARGRADHNRLQWSVNLFDQRFFDTQRTLRREVTTPAGTIEVSELANAPRARSRGIEAEARWQALPNLSIGGALGFLHTRLTRTLLPKDPIAGKEFQRAPHVSASAMIDWKLVPRLTLSTTVHGQGRYFSDDANTPSLAIAPGALVDAKFTYQAGPIRLSVYGRNILDRYALTFYQSRSLATATPPREIGAEIEGRF